jgi:hypothetical protein
LRLTLGTGAVPVPLSDTVRGLPLPLSVIVTAPVRAPVAVGVNVTLIEQFAPAATDDPQVFVCANSPEVLTLEIVSAALPLFVSVMLCAELVDCTA